MVARAVYGASTPATRLIGPWIGQSGQPPTFQSDLATGRMTVVSVVLTALAIPPTPASHLIGPWTDWLGNHLLSRECFVAGAFFPGINKYLLTYCVAQSRMARTMLYIGFHEERLLPNRACDHIGNCLPEEDYTCEILEQSLVGRGPMQLMNSNEWESVRLQAGGKYQDRSDLLGGSVGLMFGQIRKGFNGLSRPRWLGRQSIGYCRGKEDLWWRESSWVSDQCNSGILENGIQCGCRRVVSTRTGVTC
jgi:hypothetical protein